MRQAPKSTFITKPRIERRRYHRAYQAPGKARLRHAHSFDAYAALSWRAQRAGTVAHVYKALWTVEDIIRTSKSILETRPIYHKRDATIRGHVFCSFLALLLKQELESRMKRTDLEWEWKEVIRGLDALQQVEANFQGRHFLFRSQLTAHASQAVRATGVAIPPTLRELQ